MNDEAVSPKGCGPEGGSLRLEGDLENRQLDEMRESLSSLTACGGTVDLSGVTFFPSTAVAVLIDARRRASSAGATLRLVAEAGSIAGRVLRVLAIDHDHL